MDTFCVLTSVIIKNFHPDTTIGREVKKKEKGKKFTFATE